MINENDAKTLGIVSDKEKKLHSYSVTYHLVTGEELNYVVDNVSLTKHEIVSSVITNTFMGVCSDGPVKIRGLSDDETIGINMNLVTHFNVKEITND